MNSKEKILITSIKLFAEYGFDATSMSKIANAIGVTKPALYAHFDNKVAIFENALDKISSEYIDFMKFHLAQANPNSVENKLSTFLITYLSAQQEDQTSIAFFNRLQFFPTEGLEDLIKTHMEECNNTCNALLTEVITTGIKSGEIDSRLSASQVLNTYLCLMYGFTCSIHLFQEESFPGIWEVFWRGIKA